LWLLLRTRVRRALGRVLTPLLLGLLRLLLRCRNHLIYGALSCGCYTNAYEMIECNSNYTITTIKRNVLRTVRAQMADRPQYNSTDPPDTTTSLDKLQNYRADCPLQNSGPSAVQLRKITRGNDASGQILNSTADCPALLGGPSAVHSANSTRDDNVSGQNSRLYGGLSALQ
jgi:hypothetical protein